MGMGRSGIDQAKGKRDLIFLGSQGSCNSCSSNDKEQLLCRDTNEDEEEEEPPENRVAKVKRR